MLPVSGLRSAIPGPVLKVGLTMSVALLGDALLYVALPAHSAELHLPLWAVGVLLGANRIVRLFTNTLAARLFKRFGGRGPMIGASLGAVATTAAYGLLPFFPALLVARAGWGMCFSILRLGSFTAVMAASVPRSRGRLVGMYQSISRVGPVASLLAGGLMVESLGFHTTFVLLALLTLPALGFALSLKNSSFQSESRHGDELDDRRPTDHAPPSDWRQRWLGGPRLVAVKLGMLVNGFASQGVVISTVALALAEASGTVEGAAAIAGILVAIRWGFDLSLAPVLGHLSDRLGRPRVIPALLIAEAAAIGALALSADRLAVIAATLTVFLISTAMTAASDAAAGDLAPPKRRAEVMSSYADWIDIGAAIGPPLAFVLTDWLGLRASYALTASVVFATALQFITAWRRERGDPPTERVAL